MPKKTLATVFGLIGALVVGAAVYLYTLISEAGDMWPAKGKPGTLTAQIGRLKNEVRALNDEVAKIPAAKERRDAIAIDYELAANVLPRESTPDQLIAAIRTKALQSDVLPTRLTHAIQRAGTRGRSGGAEGAFETWRFTLTLQGSYDQIASFVNRMEEFESTDAAKTGAEKRFFEVKDITITSAGNGLANLEFDVAKGSGTKPIMHTCNVVMQTYRYTGE